MRYNLLTSINNLESEKLNLLGFVMGQVDYISIDADQNAEPVNNKNSNTIELDVQNISINKIKFLQEFIDNPKVQEKYTLMV